MLHLQANIPVFFLEDMEILKVFIECIIWETE